MGSGEGIDGSSAGVAVVAVGVSRIPLIWISVFTLTSSTRSLSAVGASELCEDDLGVGGSDDTDRELRSDGGPAGPSETTGERWSPSVEIPFFAEGGTLSCSAVGCGELANELRSIGVRG